MRCRQAENRLSEARPDGFGFSDDRELMDHLRNCPACAKQAKAAQLLKADFEAMSIGDEVDSIPLSVLRTRVEAQARSAGQPDEKELNIMAFLTNQIRKRSRLSVSIAVVAAVLAVGTLIPFSYENTVGYEVALAGVDRNVALNEFKIQEMLSKLGIDHAVINATDCEATCNVNISDLKSQGDVQLVVEAFKNVDELVELHEVRKIVGEESGSLAHQAKVMFIVKQFHDGENNEFISDGEAHQIVCDKLGADFSFGDLAWIAKEDGDEGEITLDLQLNCDSLGPNVQIFHTDDGNVAMFIGDGSGQLTELHEIDEGDDIAKEGTVAELPDGYSLKQNYPNPFNPTTQIDFSLAEGGPVTLEVYNLQGQKVATIVDRIMSAGEHTVEWDATSEAGVKVSSGVYFYRLSAGDVTQSKKMILAK